jgi:hypothetical protein
MVDDVAEKKVMSAGAQAVAAVVLVGGLVGGAWGLRDVYPQSSAARGPAACSNSSTDDVRPSKHISGAQLCTALNRPDLPKLLGTPAEQAESASGSESYLTLAGGTKISTPAADVTL